MKELRSLNKYLFKYKIQLLLGIIITITSRIFSLFAPRLINKSLTKVENFINQQNISIEELKDELALNIGVIILASLISGFLTFLTRQTIINVSRYIEYDLKNEIYNHYQKLSMDFYKNNRTGDLMTRITEDVSKVRMYFGPALMYSITTFSLFVIVIASMLSLSVELALYTLLPLPILSIIIYKLSKEVNSRTTIIQKTLSSLSSFSQEAFSGISVIKSYNIERKIQNEFNFLSDKSKIKNLDLAKVQAWFFPLMILMIGLSNLLVIFIGGNKYINGQIEIGVLAEFILYVFMLTWPVATVGWVTSIIQQAEASQKRINLFLNKVPKINDGKLIPKKIEGSIKFKSVSYKYKETKIQALKNITFEINSGETLGIIGDTGAGKSTILDLICRLFESDKGEILIDKININKFSLKSLRNSIGYVTQNPFLFSESILENIKFGNHNASLKEISKAAKNAGIDKEIKKFKNGYNTILGERGITLSGGQKQRVSIARALIKKPKILLFDDCLSSLDADTEKKIQKNLSKFSNEITTIIVSHNISSVRKTDKTIVIEDGKISQVGNHNELIKLDGYYKALFDKQVREKI
ncbi:MAG: ABC transporter ATP-binding protein [Flavobacteriaceae bacterium]